VAPRRGARRGGQRAPTAWAGLTLGLTSIPATSKLLLGTFSPVASFAHETIVRVVGMVSYQSSTGAHGAIGIMVASDAAVAAGVASLPSPLAEIQDDVWTTIIPLIAVSGDGVQEHFDSRGMRKVEEGQQAVVVAENGGPNPLSLILYLRLLSKVAVRS